MAKAVGVAVGAQWLLFMLIYAPAMGWGFFGLGGPAQSMAAQAPLHLGSPVKFLVMTLVLHIVYGAINATVYYGFTLRRGDEELRYERGLLQRYSGTIPLGKVQSLTIEENVLARALGYASLEIETAGGSGGEAGQDTSQSAIPIAERSRVLELANSIESVGEMEFERPPERARERYAVRYAGVVALATGLLYLVGSVLDAAIPWWAPLGALVLVPVAAHLQWRSRGYYVGEDHVVTRNGFWVRQLKVVPYYRVQTVSDSQTVFQRRRDLATLVVDTASSGGFWGGDAVALDIDVDVARALREEVHDRFHDAIARRAEHLSDLGGAVGTNDGQLEGADDPLLTDGGTRCSPPEGPPDT